MKAIDLIITLKGVEPSIWRHVRVSSKLTLLDLHYVIQHAFGWTNSHLFLMRVGSMEFSISTGWEEEVTRYQSAELAVLEDLIPKIVPQGGTFSYIYDFGDNWEHEIFVENIEDAPKGYSGAVCLAGARACPPEDVGSVPGYYELIKNLQNPLSNEFDFARRWLGFDYDPEAYDINRANHFIQDYFKSRMLPDNTYWTKELPFYHQGVDFVSPWVDQLSPDHCQIAKDLAFRQDVVSLLTYLLNNKVKGTKATGNFPRKDIRGITAGFVHPPELDMKIGEKVYSLRTEDEVPELLFLHNFVNEAALIVGGENMLWTVTHLGEMFLNSSPQEQAWFLTKFWFYQSYWGNCYPYDDVELNVHFYVFQKRLLDILLSFPLGKPIEIKRIIEELDQISPGWISVQGHEEYADFRRRHYLLRVVVEPFEKLGLFEVIKVNDEHLPVFYIYTHIVMTDYGKTLLKFFR